jgi:hypothetical protein
MTLSVILDISDSLDASSKLGSSFSLNTSGIKQLLSMFKVWVDVCISIALLELLAMFNVV